MVVAHVQRQLAVLYRKVRDVGLVVALAAERDVQRAAVQLLGEVVGEPLGHLHDDPLVEGLLEIADEAWQVVVLGGERRAQIHGAEGGRGTRSHSGHPVVDGAQGQADVLVEHLTVGGQENRASVALEQGSAQLLLQRRDGAGQGGLGDEQLLRRTGVVKHLGELLEVVQLREVHGFPPKAKGAGSARSHIARFSLDHSLSGLAWLIEISYKCEKRGVSTPRFPVQPASGARSRATRMSNLSCSRQRP